MYIYNPLPVQADLQLVDLLPNRIDGLKQVVLVIGLDGL